MKGRSFARLTTATVILIFLATAGVAFGQTTNQIALRSVSGEPNLYITVSETCGPRVTLAGKSGDDEEKVSAPQLFELIDLNGGGLEYGDKVRIKKCGNYLRVNSEGGIDSVPPVNPDGTPDSSTVFTIHAPQGSSNTGDVGLLVLGAEVRNRTEFYLNTGDFRVNTNVVGTPLTASSDFLGNPKNVLKLIRNAKEGERVFTEEREICGETVNTLELHNVRCGMSGLNCHCISDRKWCFVASELNVKTPNHRWVFSRPARVDCARDNQGSCQWNALGESDRFAILLNNPTEIRARVLTNSWSIGVRICASARYYPS